MLENVRPMTTVNVKLLPAPNFNFYDVIKAWEGRWAKCVALDKH